MAASVERKRILDQRSETSEGQLQRLESRGEPSSKKRASKVRAVNRRISALSATSEPETVELKSCPDGAGPSYSVKSKLEQESDRRTVASSASRHQKRPSSISRLA